MHVMEGFLPARWAAFWYLASLPFLLHGARRLKELFDESPEARPMVALSGAFVLVLSSLKMPSVTGSTSHPTGTGLSAVLLGPSVTAVLSVVVLLYQALFLAHGGITTLGANVFSMGIVGPAAGYAAFRLLQSLGTYRAVFAAAATANLATYLVTSLQLALAYPAASGGVPAAFLTFSSIFALTQVPLAAVEGFLIAGTFRYVAQVAPEITDRFAFDPPPEELPE